MAETGEARTSSRKSTTPTTVQLKEIQPLGIESGTDDALAWTSPFSAVSAGLVKNDAEQLQEVFRPSGEEAGPTVRQLVAMRRQDGQARALYRLLTLPVRAALHTATIVTEDEDAEEERAFIEAVFNTPPESGGMTVPFNRFMGQILQGLFDGFAAFEKVYWIPESGPLKGKITLKKIAHRPAETVTFVVDKSGGFRGIRQRTFHYGRSLDVFIPRERAFYYAAQEEEQKFYGVSFFQSAFYHYDKKARLYFSSHIAAQRAAVGTRVGTIPPTASIAAKQEFAAGMRNLSLAQWMMMPEGFKVEILKEGGTYDFLSQINHHSNQMSKSILAQFFDKDSGSGQSENTLVNFGQPGDDMFNLMLRGIMNDIASQINHYLIPALIDFNFKSNKYPKFVWGQLTDEQRSAISATFNKIAAQPDALTPEFVRALEENQAHEYGLEIDYDEVDLRMKAEADAAAAAEQAGIAIDPAAASEFPPAAPASEESAPAEWNSLDDFIAALDGGSKPEKDKVTLTALDDFEIKLAATRPKQENLLTLAQSLLDEAGALH